MNFCNCSKNLNLKNMRKNLYIYRFFFLRILCKIAEGGEHDLLSDKQLRKHSPGKLYLTSVPDHSDANCFT